MSSTFLTSQTLSSLFLSSGKLSFILLFMFKKSSRLIADAIIDLTIAAIRLASKISDWSVLEIITLSDHQCIESNLEQRCQAVDKGRGGDGRSPSWNTRRLSRERLREHLEETTIIDELGWVCHIVRSLFPHVEPFQRQNRSSCEVRREELFTLEELMRAGRRLKANTAPGIDGVPNEILKEVIRAYPEILLEASNFCLREGSFFVDLKKQRGWSC